MNQQEASEQEKFNAWWDLKGTNSVILRARAWSAWLARAEAEQPQPAEDPDEWVILDSVKYANHVPRIGVDEFFTGNGRWQTQKEHHCNGTVAYWKAHEDLIHRCRRRDLPKVEQKTLVELCANKTPTADVSILGGPHDVCVMPTAEDVQKPNPQPQKPISDESLELVVHLRDQMQVLANRVAECERVIFAKTPQPQKTRVRLFASFGAVHMRMPGEITEGIGREVKHDAEGFYVE